jgi:hypothetical protein
MAGVEVLELSASMGSELPPPLADRPALSMEPPIFCHLSVALVAVEDFLLVQMHWVAQAEEVEGLYSSPPRELLPTVDH